MGWTYGFKMAAMIMSFSVMIVAAVVGGAILIGPWIILVCFVALFFAIAHSFR